MVLLFCSSIVIGDRKNDEGMNVDFYIQSRGEQSISNFPSFVSLSYLRAVRILFSFSFVPSAPDSAVVDMLMWLTVAYMLC